MAGGQFHRDLAPHRGESESRGHERLIDPVVGGRIYDQDQCGDPSAELGPRLAHGIHAKDQRRR